jgi:hypothetical protein
MATINNNLNYLTTNHQPVVGAASNGISSISGLNNGYTLIGSTSANPVAALLASSGSTITYTTGANTLNIDVANYATGSFSPTLVGNTTAGTTTYVSQNGYYVRFLNLCYIWGSVVISAATGSGGCKFGAFPYTIKNTSNPPGFVSVSGSSFTYGSGFTYLSFVGQKNTTTALINILGSGKSGSNLPIANASGTFYFSLLHQV